MVLDEKICRFGVQYRSGVDQVRTWVNPSGGAETAEFGRFSQVRTWGELGPGQGKGVRRGPILGLRRGRKKGSKIGLIQAKISRLEKIVQDDFFVMIIL